MIVFIDAVHISVRDNGQIRKLAAYVILAVSLTGHKEVLSIHIHRQNYNVVSFIK